MTKCPDCGREMQYFPNSNVYIDKSKYPSCNHCHVWYCAWCDKEFFKPMDSKINFPPPYKPIKRR